MCAVFLTETVEARTATEPFSISDTELSRIFKSYIYIHGTQKHKIELKKAQPCGGGVVLKSYKAFHETSAILSIKVEMEIIRLRQSISQRHTGQIYLDPNHEIEMDLLGN